MYAKLLKTIYLASGINGKNYFLEKKAKITFYK